MAGYVIRHASMSSNDSDRPDPLKARTHFKTVDTISATEQSLREVISCVLEHEEAGIPLIIAGLNEDSNWSPFPQPHLSEVEARGDIEQEWSGAVS